MSQWMNRIIIIMIFGLTVHVQAAHNFGAGVVLGDPTGLSFKYDLSARNSIDAALAWSDSINVLVQGDYLWNKPKLFFVDNYPFDLFYGVGARLRDRDKDKFSKDDEGLQVGVRGPVGLRFMLHDPRIEFFTELAFIMNLTPGTSADLDFGIGARYFF